MLEESARKELKNRLFEIICSEIDVFSAAHSIDISHLACSDITRNDIINALRELTGNKLIKNVVIDSSDRMSCQMTLEGLEIFHEKVNA